MSVRKNIIQIIGARMLGKKESPAPVHVEGTTKGEELSRHEGKEPGRRSDGRGSYRTARDSTGINPESRRPIHPDSPDIPPP